MAKFEYDLIVIGGGGAGLVSSKLAHGLGKRVLLIEKDKIGGECTWTGCVPSKTVIKSAYAAYIATHLKDYGLQSKQSVDIETSLLMQHVQEVIGRVYKTETPEVIQSFGIEAQFGEAQFIDNHHIALNGKTISFAKAMLCTGSHPFVPPIEGLDRVPYLTNQNLFEIKQLPKSMIILGGGAIGCEMASALNRLGVKITIVEMGPQILSKEDPELVDILANIMRDEGVVIHTNWHTKKVSYQNNMMQLEGVGCGGNVQTLHAETLLVAVGRRPNVEGLQLCNVGVDVGKRAVKVDKTLRTTAKNIWACGDVCGPYLFSHMAFYQATIATQNALLPFWKRKVSYKSIIWATFTDPELASCGLNEAQARAMHGNSIRVYKRDYIFDRAMTEGDTRGMCKIVCDKRGYILGAQILGARAGDIIHELQVTKVFGKKLTDLYKVIHAYPTFSEVIWHTAKDAYIDSLRRNPALRVVRYIQGLFKQKK